MRMTTPIETDETRTCGSGNWLVFAAAPTFAVMAWVVAGTMTICSSDPGMLPMDSMSWMYLLMSLFHLPPWLRLVSRGVANAHQSYKQGD